MDLVSRQDSRTRCAYCHDALEEPLLRCTECSAIYHVDCNAELRSCATVGCEGLAIGQDLPIDPMLRCCDRRLPDEDHYRCSACRSIHHASCLSRTGPCCAASIFEPTSPVRGGYMPRHKERASAEDDSLRSRRRLLGNITNGVVMGMFLTLSIVSLVQGEPFLAAIWAGAFAWGGFVAWWGHRAERLKAERLTRGGGET